VKKKSPDHRNVQKVAARERAERDARREAAIQQHRLMFPKGRKRLPPSRNVKESWERIVACLGELGYRFRLNPGAPAKAIAAFEKAVGATLPEDFKESLRLHDGGDDMPPRYGELLSLARMCEVWEMYRDWQQQGTYAVGEEWRPDHIEGPIKPDFWNTKRIHVADNSGDHLTLDLDPPKRGTYGQVIKHSHEVGPLRVVARSWSEFLQQLVDDFETGKYFYFREDDTLEPLEASE
jgi:cell wall assembly regulator SMI1